MLDPTSAPVVMVWRSSDIVIQLSIGNLPVPVYVGRGAKYSLLGDWVVVGRHFAKFVEPVKLKDLKTRMRLWQRSSYLSIQRQIRQL